MGFQQQILDHLFIAFLSTMGSLFVVIPSNLTGLYFPLFGCLLNFVGVTFIFYLLYKYFYQKKYQTIESPFLYGWWFYLSLSFAITFSSPIITREAWFGPHSEILFILIPLTAYVLFELYSFRLGIRNWMKS